MAALNNSSDDEKSFVVKGQEAPLRKGQPRFGQIFLDVLDKYRDLSATIDADTGKEVTYGQLKEASIRLALWLRNQGFKKGDVVSLVTDIRIEAPIFFLAAYYEGITFIPWVPLYTLDIARHKLKITRPKVIFSITRVLSVVKEACVLEDQNPLIVTLDEQSGYLSFKEVLDSIPQADIDTYEPVIIDDLEKNVSTVFFTSGSTGKPKGASHSYLSILNNFARKYPITYPNQRGRPTLLSYFPPTFTVWYQCLISGIFEGGVYIFHRKFDPVETTRIINKYKVNYFFIRPTEVAQYVQSGVLDRPTTDLSSVEEFYTASSRTSPAIYDTFKRRVEAHSIFSNNYAMTETAYGLLRTTDYKTRENTTADPLGFPEPNVQIKIIDIVRGKVVGPHENGEICIKLPYMLLGYYNSPEETKQAIDNEGWFHSGDFGYYDERGEIFFVERLKDMIKHRGTHIMGSIIEQTLIKHPDVVETSVVAVPDLYKDELPIAFVVKRVGSKITEDDVVKLSSTLDDLYILRGGVVFLDFLPRLPNGKIDKVELKKMAKAYEHIYSSDQH